MSVASDLVLVAIAVMLVIGPAVMMGLGSAPVWAWCAVYVAEALGLLVGRLLSPETP